MIDDISIEIDLYLFFFKFNIHLCKIFIFVIYRPWKSQKYYTVMREVLFFMIYVIKKLPYWFEKYLKRIHSESVKNIN